MKAFSDRCPGCGGCRDICPFLARYGTPDEIRRERPEAAFHCTGCGRCDGGCPQGLSPSAAFAAVKERLIGQESLPPAVRKRLAGARRFAGAGHRFPFALYRGAETVFWPGCGLAAERPGLVRRVRKSSAARCSGPSDWSSTAASRPVRELGDGERAACRPRRDRRASPENWRPAGGHRLPELPKAAVGQPSGDRGPLFSGGVAAGALRQASRERFTSIIPVPAQRERRSGTGPQKSRTPWGQTCALPPSRRLPLPAAAMAAA